MVDLVTFGETLLRLSPPDDGRLETTPQFDVHVGGAESNVAVAAARLGCSCGWLSKVADSPLGRHVTGELTRHGVEPAVVWTADGRQGTYYLESGDPPRGTDVVYDRADAAITTARPAELSTDLIDEASVFHTTGITPALSERLAGTTAELLARAQAAGTTTTFDLNYRSNLWDAETAGETIIPLLASVDVLFVPGRDAGPILDVEGDPETVARTLADRHGLETVVLTRGSEGALALSEGTVAHQGTYPASDARPIGTGDAFVGGFLSQYVRGESLERALRWGAATAALKRSIPGDMALVTPAEVREVIEGESAAISR